MAEPVLKAQAQLVALEEIFYQIMGV